MSELSVESLTFVAMNLSSDDNHSTCLPLTLFHSAADHPLCVLSSYLHLPLNMWMLLKQLGQKFDLLIMYQKIL
jgi:hypothetical protein